MSRSSSSDPRAIRVRSAIQTAALELAAHSRIEQISVMDVVNRAGVSRQTFYNHFRDLDDAVYRAIREALEERLSLVERDSPQERPSKRDNILVSAHFLFWLGEHDELVANIYPSKAHQCLVEWTRRMILAGAEASLSRIKSDMSPALRQLSLRWIIGGSVGLLWERTGPLPKLSLEELVELFETIWPDTVLKPMTDVSGDA